MSLICKLFGHKPPIYSNNAGGEYGTLQYNEIDGIGRQHASLYANCPRCGVSYHVMNTHVRKDHEKTR